MKYLLDYSRGKVISEQKNILLEQVKEDYDKIKTDLGTTYSTTLTKYGISGFNIMGNDADKKTSENYIGKPTTITFTPTVMLKSDSGQDIGGLYYVCSNPDGGIQSFGNKLRYQKQYQLSNSTDKSTEIERGTLRSSFENSLKNIGTNLCKLIEKVSKKEDITKSIQTITKNESSSNTTAVTTPTTPAKTTTTPTTPTTPEKTTTTTPVNTNLGSNKYTEPIITVTYDKNFKKWIVEGFASLATMSSDSASFDELLIKKIKTSVFGSKDPEILKNKDYITLTFAEIRGGASNTWKDTVDADATFGVGGTNYRLITPIDVTNKSQGYISNVALAKKRANEFLGKIKTELPKLNAGDLGTIKVTSLTKSDVKAYSIDTGGVSDTDPTRDWVTHPLPGQHIYIKLTIKLQGPPPTKTGSLGCLKGSKIKIGYFPSKGQSGHSCDTATFDVYLNEDTLIGTVDIGNGVYLNTSCNDLTGDYLNQCKKYKGMFKFDGGTVSDGVVGGERYREITIPDNKIQEIINSSTTGEVDIYIKGKDSSYYSTKRGFPKGSGDVFTTHQETPWVSFFPNGATTATVDEAPFGKFQRCGGEGGLPSCGKNFVLRFNPCGKNKLEATMDSGVGEK
jgi:hypothetical protein